MKQKSVILALLLIFGLANTASALEEPPQVHFVVKKFNVTGDNPLSESDTQAVLQPFTGEHYGLEGLQSAADEFEQALRAKGYAFYRVTLVPQDLKDGVIRFDVSEFKIDKITLEGNKHYSEANIKKNTPSLITGKTPNTAVLSRAINMANELPTKSVKLSFAASETGAAIDAKVKVEDQDPGFFFLNLNNTGTSQTGEFRLTGAYTYANLFDSDQSFTATYTLSPDEISSVSQLGLFYSIPYYASGSKLSFFLAKSDVDTGTIGGIAISGSGTILGVTYNKRLLQESSFKHELEVSFTNKAFENNTAALTQPKVVSRPLMLAYRGSDLTTTYNLSFFIEAHTNISGGSNNEEADYDGFNCGTTITVTQCNDPSTADWSLFKYGLSFQFFKSNWIYRFALNGQESSDLLISGEQFGAGGSSSVRGYEERSILGDTGYQINLEAWMPNIDEYNIRPLIFFDMATVDRLYDPSTGAPSKDDLASFGGGIRWSWNNKLNVSTDLGYVTKAAGTVAKGDTRLHLDVFYRF